MRGQVDGWHTPLRRATLAQQELEEQDLLAQEQEQVDQEECTGGCMERRRHSAEQEVREASIELQPIATV